MRVRLWLKSTRISVATCQKERIVRRYLSLHWGAGAMPRKETWHGHEERSASCDNTLRRFQRHGRLKRRPYENHIVILYFSVFLSAAIELMPHAYIGALTNLWSVKLKTYSTNVFVTHRRSTNQFNICKPRHRNPCIHHSNTNCNTVASQSCVGAVCNRPPDIQT